jgi:uncharacterized protein YfeS
MSIPVIPRTSYIRTEDIPPDPLFGGMRIVRCQTDEAALENYRAGTYEFQTEQAKRHVIHGAVLGLKGSPGGYRVTAMTHPSLRQFTDIVRYDPSDPPLEDYEAIGMNEAHQQTQQDFKGAKKENLADFKQYLIEAILTERTAYLPPVSGWQSSAAFGDTIFVAFDEQNERALYGTLYLPKKPVMQSDGQTQTAALFQAARTGLAIKKDVLDSFGVTLEIELNVTPDQAGQSFADRNGRGSKKNKNLVAQLDISSALAQLRRRALTGTIFEHRLADGRSGGTSETATGSIMDLSTLEQILLNVMTRGNRKPEHIKHYHVEHFAPYCREFLLLLQDMFGDQWPQETPKDREPFRRIYIHGWPFAMKGLALAYHDCNRDKIGPLAGAIGSPKDEHATPEEAEKAFLDRVALIEAEPARIPFDDFKERLREIDWHRYRQHWIKLLGHKVDKDGNTKVREIKDPSAPGGKRTIVEGQAQNTAGTINIVVNKILSDSWKDLCSDVNAQPQG